MKAWSTLLLIAGFALEVAAATVTLNVEPQPMVANQSADLIFRAPFDSSNDPDFSQIEQSFDILGRSRQTSISWVNGKREQSTVWKLNVVPKQTGDITIPPIQFGTNASEAYTVKVISAPQPTDRAGADILLEVDADTRSPYVQQQVIYTVRLYARVDLSSPRFSALETTGDAVIKPLGDGRQFLHKINDVTYEAFESKFAIFAQQSGTLTIKPMVLTTQIAQRRRNFFDPFSQSLQTRRLQSEAIELEVKPIPASFPRDATWLPAKRLRIHDEWEPENREAKVGEPLSRTIVLWADGLIAGQLPEIELEPPAGVKHYPDQPQSSEKESADGFTAVAQQKFALIARNAKPVAFPPINIPWWNTETDQLEIAELAALTVGFLADEQTAAGLERETATTDATVPAVVEAETSERFWQPVAVALGCGWAISMFYFWYRFRRAGIDATAQRSASSDSPVDARPAPADALKRACNADDAGAALQALRRLAREHGSALTATGTTTREILAELGSTELAEHFDQLERNQYAAEKRAWQGKNLWKSFKASGLDKEAKSDSQKFVLPRLFRVLGQN